MKKYIVYFMLSAFFLSVIACSIPDPKSGRWVEEAGVKAYIVRGGGKYISNDGIREQVVNTNTFPVLIRCVWQYEGEETLWVKKFVPGQIYIMNIRGQEAFYIYKEDGHSLLGFIKI